MSFRNPRVLLGALILLGFSTALSAQTPIFADDFSGSSATALNGLAPDTRPGSEVWSANTNARADGTFTNSTAGTNWLPHTIQNDQVYTLTATVDFPYASGSATVTGIAFTNTPSILTNILTGAGQAYGILLVKRGGGWEFYPGPNNDTALAASGANNSLFTTDQDNFELKLVLTTSSTAAWKLEAYLGGTQVDLNPSDSGSMAYTYTTAPTLTAAGFAGATASFNFESFELAVDDSGPTETPLVFVHTKYVRPGDAMTIQGARFVQGGHAPQVWIDRIENSSDTPNPELQITDLLSVSDTTLHVRLPSSLSAGLYAVFVKSGGQVSAPMWVNRADGWQALDLCGTQIDPNRVFRLYGWNLDLPGATATVDFEDQTTFVRLPATVVENTSDAPYIITVTAPSGLIAGRNYRLIVSNGHGGTQGETHGPTFAAIATPTDALGLGVPWAGGYSFTGNVYNVKTDPRMPVHAVGDGLTDDTAAIQNALDRAFTDNGGVVYLPAGSYKVTSPLLINKRTVVRGDGMSGVNATKVLGILQRKTAHATNGSNVFVGIMDLEAVEVGLGGGPGPAFLLRVKAESNLGQVASMGNIGSSALIKDCEITSFAIKGKYVFRCENTTHVLLKNTYIRWSDGRLFSGGTTNMQIEGCTLMRTDVSDGVLDGYGGFSLGRAEGNTAILNNTFGKIGPGKIEHNNDGETILNESVPRLGAGLVTAATATTLTDSSISWAANVLTNAKAYAVIVGGPGAGQWRKVVSHTSNTVTIDTPWAITPTTSSTYTMLWDSAHWLIRGNNMTDCPRALWLYSCAMNDVVIADNTFADSAELYLRADQRLTDTPYPRFTAFRNVLIHDNAMGRTNTAYPLQFGIQAVVVDSSGSIGNAFWDVVARENSVAAIYPNLDVSNSYGFKGEGYFIDGEGAGAGLDGDQAIHGVLFDRNDAVNLDKAFRTNTGTDQITLWEPAVTNVGVVWDDTVGSGATLGSTNLVVNLALARPASASSHTGGNVPAFAVDGIVGDGSRWIANSSAGSAWLEINLQISRTLRQAHIYTGEGAGNALPGFILQSWNGSSWVAIPGATITGNTSQRLIVNFSSPVTTTKVRLVPTTFDSGGLARVRELVLWENPAPLAHP